MAIDIDLVGTRVDLGRNLIDAVEMPLWAIGMSRGLPAEARAIIVDRANEVYFSSASVWEVAIKRGLERTDFRVDPTTAASSQQSLSFPS